MCSWRRRSDAATIIIIIIIITISIMDKKLNHIIKQIKIEAFVWLV